MLDKLCHPEDLLSHFPMGARLPTAAGPASNTATFGKAIAQGINEGRATPKWTRPT